jgi:hypothetical protein
MRNAFLKDAGALVRLSRTRVSLRSARVSLSRTRVS